MFRAAMMILACAVMTSACTPGNFQQGSRTVETGDIPVVVGINPERTEGYARYLGAQGTLAQRRQAMISGIERESGCKIAPGTIQQFSNGGEIIVSLNCS